MTKRSWTCGGLATLGLVIVAGIFSAPARSGTYVVTTTNLDGPGSFKQALVFANTNPTPNTIAFQISGTPPFTISPTNALDAISQPVVIDGTTQPGFNSANHKPVIELNGAASGGTAGLRLNVGASTVRGLAINRFSLSGIVLNSPSNTVQGNFLGTDVTGLIARGGGSSGSPSFPNLLVNSSANVIGGTNAGEGNLISGGSSDGIYFLNSSNNVVLGNFIGVNAPGSAALANANNGIVLYNSGANVIGGPTPAARNVISANHASGIYVTGAGSATNLIQGNYIGPDASGSNDISTVSGDGISIISAPGNLVCSNLISANGSAGVSIQSAGGNGNVLVGNWIGPAVNGKTALGNTNGVTIFSGANGNFIGGTNLGTGNVISGNLYQGILLTSGATNNFILGNYIGLDTAGTAALRNGQDGILISGATANTIGGVTAGARNFISGNASNGVAIALATDSGNCVLGNWIGTDVTGTQPIANKLAGLRLQGSSNFIGGTVPGAGNVISGNAYQGIWIGGDGGNAKGNIVQGNLIGVTPAGTIAMGNGLVTADSGGIGISTATGNLIGGTVPGAANVISGNNGSGIWIVGSTSSSNLMQGNIIGTDASGAIRVGNVWEGIYLEQATTNLIGGTASGAGNVISGNYARGINFSNASWNVIQGNLVGTMPDGVSAMGNQFHNVDLQLGSSNNVVGGAAPGAGNVFAFAQSVYCGVRVRTGAANNLISGNAIFSNGALGIDLSPTSDNSYQNAAGVNPIASCENGVFAYAANAGQNFPVLSNVVSGATTRVRGSLNSKSGRTYTLEFFASPVGFSSGYGQGQIYLGQTTVTLTSCSTNFTAFLPATVPPGWVVTATATDPNHNTSEFSAWIQALTIPPLRLTATASNPGSLALAWTNNGGSFALQQTYSLTPPIVWSTVTNPTVLANNFWNTTLLLSNIFVSPFLSAKPAQQTLTLSWTNYGGSFVLQQSPNLTPPIVWSPVATTPVLTNNIWVVTPATTMPSVFYRLAAPQTVFFRLVAP